MTGAPAGSVPAPVVEPELPQPAMVPAASAAMRRSLMRTAGALRASAVSVTRAGFDGERADGLQDIGGQARAVGGAGRGGDDAGHDLVAIDLLDADVRGVAGRDG